MQKLTCVLHTEIDHCTVGWLHSTVVERWSLAGELYLSCSTCSWWATTIVGKSPATGQPKGQLSLLSFQGWYM